MIGRITDDRQRGRGVRQSGFLGILKTALLRMLKKLSRYLESEDLRPEPFENVLPLVTRLELLAEVSLGGHSYFIIRGKRKEPGTWKPLTPREHAVAALVSVDRRDIEVAKELRISHRTVATHLQNIFKKWEISSRKELALVMAAQGLIPLSPMNAESEPSAPVHRGSRIAASRGHPAHPS